MEADQGIGGAAAGAAAGAAIGTMLPVIGTMIGGLIGGVLGLFVSRSSKESEAEGKANDAIESIIGQLQSVIPDTLEKHARQFITGMRDRIAAQLAAQRENLERIEQQLTADCERKQQIQSKAELALASVAHLLEHNSQQQTLPAEATADVA